MWEITLNGLLEGKMEHTNYSESILLGICEKLQLSPSLYKQATERYETIAHTIQNDPVFKDIELKMYPQGSFRLKTTVKPLSEEEYDIDFVVQIPAYETMSPRELYDHIVRILRHDGTHNDMVELKKRCVRVNYSNDFHMDIMPGALVNPATHEIIVPDRKLAGWYHHSNPIGFSEWFEKQARTQIINERKQFGKFSCEVEKVTEQEITSRLEPLRRAVQLVKRYRDIYCEKHSAEPVRSIVICTLMGQITSYAGDTLKVLDRFCTYVNMLILQSGDKPFEVQNPVVNEKLTEKWDEGNNYQDFVDMMKALTADVMLLKQKKVNRDINPIFKKMFGETVTNYAIAKFAKNITKARVNGTLAMDNHGTLNTNGLGVQVKKNTFYGTE